ncbi:multidrug resistance protein MdtL [Anaplasma platys]|uniref:Bcr/CflA family efflux transporter n=1 Tax=Anaplasma platys TaxID=949 RepID=A0A858PXH0_9RICK|nr:multidrug effflux MFS transporter [Anaplasma platys]QJC27277.1 multidrug resistance protein MdtL [Anaplasma platys]
MRKVVILGLVVASIFICDVAYDMYAPVLPQISSFFGVPQTIVQFTVSLNLLGGALSGLVYGPLSDRYGRRPVLLSGVAIFVLASIGCCFAQSIGALIVLRFFQGLGTGAAGVVGYATVNDMYPGESSAKSLSIVNMLVAFSPVLGPIIGSYMLAWGFGWRFLFAIITVMAGGLLLVLMLWFTETIKEKKATLTSRAIVLEYIALFKNRRFLGFSLIQSLTIMWIWASVAGLPFVFIEGMNLPVKYYGYLVAISVTAYIVGTFANRWLMERFSLPTLITIGLIAVVICDSSVAICYHIERELVSPLFIELIWVPSSFAIAFITANSMASAFANTPDKGVASSFIVFWQTIFGAAGIYIVSRLYDGSILPIAAMAIICCCIGLVVIRVMCLKRLKI